MSSKTPVEYTKEKSERRRKKTNQQYIRRFPYKRKRSLVSLLSTSSISSIANDRAFSFDENYDVEQSNLSQNDTSTSISTSLITDMFDDGNLNLLSDTESDILPHMYSSSISTSSSSSSSSDDSSSEDELDTMDVNSHLPDHRPLHSSTSTTVSQFAYDILEFCRISHLPDKQRSHLLELFQKYLPSPNLVPNSSDDLLGKFLSFYLFPPSKEYTCVEY
jgi:hypothetical protein